VISDAGVERSFGTGALKITPGHDQTDAEIGERHGLPAISVIGTDAKMTDAVEPEFAGLDRFVARELAVKRLRERGAIIKEEPYTVSTGLCYRSDTIVEPLLSLQWFVKIKPLAQPALEATRSGRITFVPERFRRVYEDWMEHIRDWCISRQIWWGHRLPVWYCPDGHVTVAETAPKACEVCGKGELRQDEDTLDTWFSSGLWPFSILGWPEKTPEFDAWYPTQLLITAREIIFNWVARMIMFGLKFAGDIPFSQVLITPVILDEQGRKMSKSLGNALDPMQLIEDYGADATRFGIVNQMHGTQDVRFAIGKCEEARKFCNKLWQATRFALDLTLGDGAALPDAKAWTLPDRWIMDALALTVEQVTQALRDYDFAEAASVMYAFMWNQVCDVYIEICKDKAPQRAPILRHVLAVSMQLLHPIMPFVTEELWQRLAHQGEFIGRSRWPEKSAGREDSQARGDMQRLLEFVDAVNSLRALPKLPYREMRDVTVVGAHPEFVGLFEREQHVIARLARAERVLVPASGDGRPAQAVTRRLGGMEIFLPVDAAYLEKERAGLRKEIDKASAEAGAIERKLKTGFVEKAPAAVVQKERARLAELRTAIEMSEERLKSL
jgi:valyl-tRNA synthetase